MKHATFTLTATYNTQTGAPQHFVFGADVADVDEARAIAAGFPNRIKVTGHNCGTSNGDIGIVRCSAVLTPSRTTGELNEAGLRRYHDFLRIAASLGHTVVYSGTFGNAYPTQEAFEAALVGELGKQIDAGLAEVRFMVEAAEVDVFAAWLDAHPLPERDDWATPAGLSAGVYQR